MMTSDPKWNCLPFFSVLKAPFYWPYKMLMLKLVYEKFYLHLQLPLRIITDIFTSYPKAFWFVKHLVSNMTFLLFLERTTTYSTLMLHVVTKNLSSCPRVCVRLGLSIMGPQPTGGTFCDNSYLTTYNKLSSWKGTRVP